MFRDILDFMDDKRTKANITMGNGEKYCRVDLLGNAGDNVVGFVHGDGIRLLNRSDVLYIDIFLEDN